MSSPILPYRIFPLGDTAVTVDFGNVIEETINLQVMALYYQLQADPIPGTIEVLPAYSSVTIYYDIYGAKKNIPVDKTVYETIAGQLEHRLTQPFPAIDIPTRFISIPVCYEKEFAPDLADLARMKNMSVDEVIQLHCSRQYRVYMLGFLPGFAYMGKVDERIAAPRKSQPVPVSAGSVGIAGKQTGIYPQTSPGGWQIIGRTPLKLFEDGFLDMQQVSDQASADAECLLHSGDNIEFIPISKNEFENY